MTNNIVSKTVITTPTACCICVTITLNNSLLNAIDASQYNEHCQIPFVWCLTHFTKQSVMFHNYTLQFKKMIIILYDGTV